MEGKVKKGKKQVSEGEVVELICFNKYVKLCL